MNLVFALCRCLTGIVYLSIVIPSVNSSICRAESPQPSMTIDILVAELPRDVLMQLDADSRRPLSQAVMSVLQHGSPFNAPSEANCAATFLPISNEDARQIESYCADAHKAGKGLILQRTQTCFGVMHSILCSTTFTLLNEPPMIGAAFENIDPRAYTITGSTSTVAMMVDTQIFDPELTASHLSFQTRVLRKYPHVLGINDRPFTIGTQVGYRLPVPLVVGRYLGAGVRNISGIVDGPANPKSHCVIIDLVGIRQE